MSDTTIQPPASVDVPQAIWQLRSLLCGLGAMTLVLSLAFNVFVWKQNRNITAAATNRKQQLLRAEAQLNEMSKVANELAAYSNGRPELTAIFTRFGIELKPRTTDTDKPSP